MKEDGDRKPNLYEIFNGEVANVQSYGAFIKIPNCKRQGLVHKSQMSTTRIEDPNEMLAKGEKVFCKVISIENEGDKISLSMKVVNQTTGADQDPNNVQSSQDERKRRQWNFKGSNKIELGAELNTTCRRCGGHGHLTLDCFVGKGDNSYDMIPDMKELLDRAAVEEEKEATTHKKKKSKHKKDQKKKKKKSKKKEKHNFTSCSESCDSDNGKKKKKSKKRKQSSTSSSEDSDSDNRKKKKKSIKRKQSFTSSSEDSDMDDGKKKKSIKRKQSCTSSSEDSDSDIGAQVCRNTKQNPRDAGNSKKEGSSLERSKTDQGKEIHYSQSISKLRHSYRNHRSREEEKGSKSGDQNDSHRSFYRENSRMSNKRFENRKEKVPHKSQRERIDKERHRGSMACNERSQEGSLKARNRSHRRSRSFSSCSSRSTSPCHSLNLKRDRSGIERVREEEESRPYHRVDVKYREGSDADNSRHERLRKNSHNSQTTRKEDSRSRSRQKDYTLSKREEIENENNARLRGDGKTSSRPRHGEGLRSRSAYDEEKEGRFRADRDRSCEKFRKQSSTTQSSKSDTFENVRIQGRGKRKRGSSHSSNESSDA